MKKQMAFLLLISIVALTTNAKVSVLFHPKDPTLEKAADWIRQARSSVNMIMYNIDSTDQSPVYRLLTEPDMQKRIRHGDLKIRLIFEGSGEQEASDKKMAAFESLGVDVRQLRSSLSLHHKFAVIDQGINSAKLISGSANWSISSYRNYNENILFIEEESAIANEFAIEFARWWKISKEFGETIFPNLEHSDSMPPDPLLATHFNSINFKGTRVIDRQAYPLTREVVSEINKARTEILIATTRIKLRPIYDALVAAARRGVNVFIVVSMDEYRLPFQRQTEPVPCEDIWQAECSSGKNYSDLLDLAKTQGLPVSLRVKFYHLKTSQFITHQMHSKYMIVDRQKVLSGSFNWSYASEYSNIENVIELEGSRFPEAVTSYVANFFEIHDMNRESYSMTRQKVLQAYKNQEKISCRFDPMVLTMSEIDDLLLVKTEEGTTKKTEVICQ